MHVIITGYSHKKDNKNQTTPNANQKPPIEFADIRLVAVQDKGDDLNLASQNGATLLSRIHKSIVGSKDFEQFCKTYHINRNNIVLEAGNSNNRKNDALRFSVPTQYFQQFLDATIFKSLEKMFQNNNISYTFDKQNVIDQVLTAKATEQDVMAALKITNDYVEHVYKTLDSQEGKDFLNKIVGRIKMPVAKGPAEAGWEYVQFSEHNSLMIYAQYKSINVIPRFVCTARHWATFFNRKLKPNAVGAVIEIPYDNKMLDTNRYEDLTKSNYDADLKSGGARGYKAIKLGNEQYLPPKNGVWEYGYVFDESQTELMVDSRGNSYPDILNDPTETRRVTNVGKDATLTNVVASQNQQQAPQQVQPQPQQQQEVNPFGNNTGLIHNALENAKNSIDIVQKRKFNANKYDSVLPLVNKGLSNPKPSFADLYNVVNAIAMIELSQFAPKGPKIDIGREVYAGLASNIVMLCGGFGDATQARKLAQFCLADYKHAKKVHDTVSNIMNILNGTLRESLIIEEDLFRIPSFDEFLNICGIDEEDLINKEYDTQSEISAINEQFKRYFNKLH